MISKTKYLLLLVSCCVISTPCFSSPIEQNFIPNAVDAPGYESPSSTCSTSFKCGAGAQYPILAACPNLTYNCQNCCQECMQELIAAAWAKCQHKCRSQSDTNCFSVDFDPSVCSCNNYSLPPGIDPISEILELLINLDIQSVAD